MNDPARYDPAAPIAPGGVLTLEELLNAHFFVVTGRPEDGVPPEKFRLLEAQLADPTGRSLALRVFEAVDEVRRRRPRLGFGAAVRGPGNRAATEACLDERAAAGRHVRRLLLAGEATEDLAAQVLAAGGEDLRFIDLPGLSDYVYRPRVRDDNPLELYRGLNDAMRARLAELAPRLLPGFDQAVAAANSPGGPARG